MEALFVGVFKSRPHTLQQLGERITEEVNASLRRCVVRKDFRSLPAARPTRETRKITRRPARAFGSTDRGLSAEEFCSQLTRCRRRRCLGADASKPRLACRRPCLLHGAGASVRPTLSGNALRRQTLVAPSSRGAGCPGSCLDRFQRIARCRLPTPLAERPRGGLVARVFWHITEEFCSQLTHCARRRCPGIDASPRLAFCRPYLLHGVGASVPPRLGERAPAASSRSVVRTCPGSC